MSCFGVDMDDDVTGFADNFEGNYFFAMFLLFLDAEIFLFAIADNNL